MTRQRIVVLASGSGTLLQALVESATGIGADIAAVGADRMDAPALTRAPGAEPFCVPVQDYGSRSEWDRAITDAVAVFAPDWVVSLGFMRVLGPAFLDHFGGRIVNSHPALLPAFPGAHAVRDALAYGVKVTGCTVHLVDAGVDSGPIIAQVPVAVETGDNEASLHERIKVVERRLVVSVLADLIANGYRIDGRMVSIP